MSRRRQGIALACVALAALGAAGCHRDRAAPYARTVAEAMPRIEAAVGVKFKSTPKVEERSKEEVRAFLLRELADSTRMAELAGKQSVYRTLGLISDTVDLKKVMIDLLTEQVSGFYDPKTKVLYVVKGLPHDQVGLVVWHELVHALQDQYVNTDSLLDQRDNDRVSAVQALLEGEATLESVQAIAGPAAADGLFSNWGQIKKAIRENRQIMPAFVGAPLIVQESALFPYLSGAEFVRLYKAAHQGKPPFLDTLPASTEQIVSRQAYFGKVKDEPIEITLPAPKSGTATYTDDLGEFETRVFLFQHLQSQEDAVNAAAGWGGDRYMVVKTASGDALVWLTMWDTAQDAVEFKASLEHVIGIRYPDAKGVSLPHDISRYDTYRRSIIAQGGDIAGHPFVLYVDVPKGTSTDLIDLSKVRASR